MKIILSSLFALEFGLSEMTNIQSYRADVFGPFNPYLGGISGPLSITETFCWCSAAPSACHLAAVRGETVLR